MNKSHLLINEPALQVLPSLAKSIGLEEAIILQQLHYWLNNSKVDGRIEDGEKWIYNSYQEWQDNFPFWSVQQIQRIFLNLEKGGVVISAKLDAKKHDQTKFYRIDYDVLCTMDESILIPSNISESNDVNKELHRLPDNTGLTEEEKEQVNNGLTSYLALSQAPGIKAEARRNSILSYLGERLHVNTETKAWREFAKYADGQQQNGEKVEVFISWLLGQKGFDLQYWPPRRMAEMWPQAFIPKSERYNPNEEFGL
jgi:hypothetical protein